MKYPESVSTAAQYLKKAVPRIMECQVPANPVNYTLWYNYVSGLKPDLSAELDLLLKLNGTYDEDQARDLYYHYFIREYLSKEQISLEGLSDLAEQLLAWLSDSTRGSSEFGESLELGLEQLKHATSMTEINQVVAEVIAATESIQAANQRFQSQLDQANQEIEDLRKKLEETEYSAYIDQLTQVYNRSAFDKQLTQLIETESINKSLCLIIFDVDLFKSFNDQYGHIIGDRILQRIGELLQDYASEKAINARYGGEEFAIILSGSTLRDAAVVAEEMRQRIQSLRVKLRNSQRVLDSITASFGVASFQAGDTIESFIHRADQALYRAKNAGRNRIEIAGELE